MIIKIGPEIRKLWYILYILWWPYKVATTSPMRKRVDPIADEKVSDFSSAATMRLK